MIGAIPFGALGLGGGDDARILSYSVVAKACHLVEHNDLPRELEIARSSEWVWGPAGGITIVRGPEKAWSYIYQFGALDEWLSSDTGKTWAKEHNLAPGMDTEFFKGVALGNLALLERSGFDTSREVFESGAFLIPFFCLKNLQQHKRPTAALQLCRSICCADGE